MKHTAIRTKSNQIVSFLVVDFYLLCFHSLSHGRTKCMSDLLDIVFAGVAELLKNDEHSRRTDSSVATVVGMTKRRKKN